MSEMQRKGRQTVLYQGERGVQHGNLRMPEYDNLYCHRYR